MPPPRSLGGFTGPTIALPVRHTGAEDALGRQRRVFVVPRHTAHRGLVALYDLGACAYRAIAFVGSCQPFTEPAAERLKEPDRRWLRGLPIGGFVLLLVWPSPLEEPVPAPRPRLYGRVEW